MFKFSVQRLFVGVTSFSIGLAILLHIQAVLNGNDLLLWVIGWTMLAVGLVTPLKSTLAASMIMTALLILIVASGLLMHAVFHMRD
jgi:hypothetical protein